MCVLCGGGEITRSVRKEMLNVRKRSHTIAKQLLSLILDCRSSPYSVSFRKERERENKHTCTALCRLVVRSNRQKVQCLVYTTTSFLFSLCSNCCFRYIIIHPIYFYLLLTTSAVLCFAGQLFIQSTRNGSWDVTV